MSAPSPTPTPLQIGLVLFPRVTQLDFTGPLQVFSSLPGAKVHLIWKRIEPVTSDSVLVLTPTTTFADCPQLDVICVPGGFGTDDMINDEEMLAFLRKQAPGERRAGGAVGRGRAGHVGNMRLFPFSRRVALLGRSNINGVMQPAMP